MRFNLEYFHTESRGSPSTSSHPLSFAAAQILRQACHVFQTRSHASWHCPSSVAMMKSRPSWAADDKTKK